MSIKPYPKYKDSGVEWLGMVPEHWSVEPFKWQIERNDGGVWGDDPDGQDDIIVLRSTEQTVDGNWKIEDPAPRKLTKSEIDAALLVDGDLLVTKSSGSSLHIGKTTLVTPEIAKMRCCYSNFMQRIRTRASFLPKLAWHVLNNELARRQFDLLSNSTTGLANLNGTMVGQILVPIPTLHEQSVIASFLDHETSKIDALIAEQERTISLLAEKRLAVISHALTRGIHGKPLRDTLNSWVPSVAKGWSLGPLKHLATIKAGFAFSSDEFVTEGVPLIRIGEVDPILGVNLSAAVYLPTRWLQETPEVIVKERDILMAMTGGTIGKTGWYASNENALLNQRVCIFRAKENAHQRYIWYLVNSYSFMEQLKLSSVGGAQPNISDTALLRCVVGYPSKEEQMEVSEYLDGITSAFDELIQEATHSIELLQERRTALISAAVTGKIDVRGYKGRTAA